MTKKEFVSQIQIREKKVRRGYFTGLTVVGLWMVSAPLLDHFYDLNKSKMLLQVWCGFGMAMCIAVFAVLLVYGNQRGVPCRHCGKRLFGIPGQIAVATGNCGYCGEKAFG